MSVRQSFLISLGASRAIRPFEGLIDNLRRNRRLQIGLALILLLVAAEGFLRWSDRLTERLDRLQQSRAELRKLRGQSRDEPTLQRTLDELRARRATTDARLWVVSSEAVGQARLKDWMKYLLKRNGIASQSLKVSAARPVGETQASATSATSAASPDTASSGPVAAESGGLRQIQATVSFLFTPATLEKLLGDIEGGDIEGDDANADANVDGLTIIQRERRAELTVRVLMRIDRTAPPPPPLPAIAPEAPKNAVSAPLPVPAALPLTSPVASTAPQRDPSTVPVRPENRNRRRVDP